MRRRRYTPKTPRNQMRTWLPLAIMILVLSAMWDAFSRNSLSRRFLLKQNALCHPLASRSFQEKGGKQGFCGRQVRGSLQQTSFSSASSRGCNNRKVLSRGALDSAAAAISAYEQLLQTAPLETKGITSAIFFGIGDAIAQARSDTFARFDFQRTAKYIFTGIGNGILWHFWYALVQVWVGALVTVPIMQVGISIALEQFLWCPILYSMYLIPLSTVLNGGGLQAVKENVRSRLAGLLVANAKVWTFANLLIYSLPLEWRVLGANVVELFWAYFCADIAAACGEECEIRQEGSENSTKIVREVPVA